MSGMKDMTLMIHLKADGNAAGKVAAVGPAGKTAAGGLAAMGAAASAALGPIILITAAIAAFTIAFKFISSAIKLAIEFEDVMVRTQAVTGSTAEQMGVLEGEVRALASATRFTATEVAQAAQVMSIAGVSFDEMVSDKALERVLQLAEVGGVDVPTAAGIAIAAIKGFRMELDQLGEVNDVIAFSMTRTNVTMTSLGEALKYLGPTAAATGISIQESAAAIGKLGDAGIQGTLAGTQLRNAINKLISPSEDARRTIDRLGLDVYNLTPAGDAATMTLRNVTSDLDRTRQASQNASDELKALTREMSGMSLEQQRNNLAIMQIRRKAEREGRSLTDSEMERIRRLEGANADLDLTLAESGIKRAEMKMKSDDLKDSEKSLASQFTQLNGEVSSQIMGLTSLVDVLDQLKDSGATTAEIMEIFGVRGGGAILALLGQHEGFVQLVDDLDNAEGSAEKMAETIGSSTAGEIAKMKSAFDEAMLSIGQEFLPILRDDIIPMLRDDFIPLLKDIIPVIQAILDVVTPVIKALARMLDLMNKVDKATGQERGSTLKRTLLAPLGPAGLLFMAEGGLVTQPTAAIIGEAGPEVVIPLDQFKQWMNPKEGQRGAASATVEEPRETPRGGGVVIQNVTISGVLNADDVGMVIEQSLPGAINRALSRNVRGSLA